MMDLHNRWGALLLAGALSSAMACDKGEAKKAGDVGAKAGAKAEVKPDADKAEADEDEDKAETDKAEAAPVGELGPVGKVWAEMPHPPEFVAFFEGTFETMVIEVQGTDERFTIHNSGKDFEFRPGAAEDADFTVPVDQSNIDALAAYVKDGTLSNDEASKIMGVLMVPYTRAIMSSPSTSSAEALDLAGLATTICSELVDKQGAVVAAQRLVHEGEEWDIRSPIDGPCERNLRFDAFQARDHQRAAFKALKTNTLAGWNEYLEYYKTWREGVSVDAPKGEVAKAP